MGRAGEVFAFLAGFLLGMLATVGILLVEEVEAIVKRIKPRVPFPVHGEHPEIFKGLGAGS